MDKNILKYKQELIDIAASFVADVTKIEDIVFCGSRAGDWYEEDSDVDVAVGLNDEFVYSPLEHWFQSRLNGYDVDIFLVPTNKLGFWRGLKSPYVSLYTGEHFKGSPTDIEWLRTHKPALRERKRGRI